MSGHHGAQSDASNAEDGNRLGGPHAQGVHDDATAGQDGAADNGRNVRGHIVVQGDHQPLGENSVFRPGGRAHVDRFTVPLSLYPWPGRRSRHGSPVHPGGHYVVALPHVANVAPVGHHYPGGLMPQQDCRRLLIVGRAWLRLAMDLVELGMTNAAGKELYQDLVRFRVWKLDLIDDQRAGGFDQYCSFGSLHGCSL